MDKYGLPTAERKLPGKWGNWLAVLCGCLAPVFFPPIHIGILYFFWEDFSRSVDKHFCSCSCWDTVFKGGLIANYMHMYTDIKSLLCTVLLWITFCFPGTYETGVAAYKHLYFNATSNTFKIWILTVVSMIALYECIRHLTLLMLQRQLRFSMLVLFLSSIFAHYYSWWAYVNYWNDDYYSQWNHQLFFTLSELVSTVLVVHLAHSENSVTVYKVLGIIGIALIHVVAGGSDQFIENVVRGEGYSHQVSNECNDTFLL